MRNLVIYLTGVFIILIVSVSFYLLFQRSRENSSNSFLNKEVTNFPKLMKIESPAFANNEAIPIKYTCDGENINPPLKIENVPSSTKSLVLIVDDPDAPGRTFLHWLLWNIPPQTKNIPENSVPERAFQGITDFGKKGWGGPCPPRGVGTHHYHFKLYALDKILDISPSAGAQEVKEAMENHIIDKAELVALYKR